MATNPGGSKHSPTNPSRSRQYVPDPAATIGQAVDIDRLTQYRPQHADAPPPEIPGYQFTRLLGAGGMGRVFLARHTRLGQEVAIKYALDTAPTEAVLRLRLEAEAAARVRHPNMIRVYDYNDTPVPHVVMEYCPGGDLQARLREAPLAPPTAAAVAETLGQAVHALNTHGGIHRDLKPANVLLTADGQPVVADLGLVRVLGAPDTPGSGPERPDPGQPLTQTGKFIGTPAYAPPEFVTGHANRADARSDVYGLGAVLYHCLTGRAPFSGRMSAVLADVVRQGPPPPATLRAGVPRDLEAICLKCLEKDPDRRYATAAELSDDLKRYRFGGPVTARPLRTGNRLRRSLRGVFRSRELTITDPETLFRTTFATAAGPSAPPFRPSEASAGAVAQSEAVRPDADVGPAEPVNPPAEPPVHPPVGRDPSPDDRGRRPSCLGLLNPGNWFRPVIDPVTCSVFAPPAFPPGTRLLVQVFAHLPDRAAEAEARARKFDPNAVVRGDFDLDLDVRRGTKLAVQLLLPEFDVGQPWRELVWHGRTRSVQFDVTAPPGLLPGNKFGTTRAWLNGVPVGEVVFQLTVTPPATPPHPPAAVGSAARRYRRVFVSYASADRNEVLKRVQGVKAAGLQVFQDVLDLEPGVLFEPELFRRIDDADLFMLFWSSSARRSDYVRKELKYALDRKAGKDHEPPAIVPVVIEGPPPPKPPTELADRHFNDPVLYFLTPPQS